MNTNLHNLLCEWQPEVPEPASFRRSVWRRIEAACAAESPGLLESFFLLIARPRLAFAVAAVAVVMGGIVGSSIASANETTAYLRSVNPYAQIR